MASVVVVLFASHVQGWHVATCSGMATRGGALGPWNNVFVFFLNLLLIFTTITTRNTVSSSTSC